MQSCMIISLENNNSVKFTSSREDNYTTNDIMVMKIPHAQLHIYTNIMYKFQRSTCITVRGKLQTKLCLRTAGRTTGQIDGRTAMAIPVYPPPLCCGGYTESCTYEWLYRNLKSFKLEL